MKANGEPTKFLIINLRITIFGAKKNRSSCFETFSKSKVYDISINRTEKIAFLETTLKLGIILLSG